MTTEKLKARARAALILFHGVDKPSERDVNLYLLYGKPPKAKPPKPADDDGGGKASPQGLIR